MGTTEMQGLKNLLEVELWANDLELITESIIQSDWLRKVKKATWDEGRSNDAWCHCGRSDDFARPCTYCGRAECCASDHCWCRASDPENNPYWREGDE